MKAFIILAVLALIAYVCYEPTPTGPTEAERKRALDNAFAIEYEKAILNDPNISREQKHELLKTVPNKRMK